MFTYAGVSFVERAGEGVRPVPAAQGAAQADRRHDVGRRAADARHGPGADHRSCAPAARRAVDGIGAVDRRGAVRSRRRAGAGGPVDLDRRTVRADVLGVADVGIDHVARPDRLDRRARRHRRRARRRVPGLGGRVHSHITRRSLHDQHRATYPRASCRHASQEFQREVDGLKVTGGKASPERTWSIVGGLLLLAGLVITFIAWLLHARHQQLPRDRRLQRARHVRDRADHRRAPGCSWSCRCGGTSATGSCASSTSSANRPTASPSADASSRPCAGFRGAEVVETHSQ